MAEKAARLGIDTADLAEDEILQLIFRSGLSTTDFVTDISGRGVGLDVVQTHVEAARGRIEVRSEPGAGTEFRIIVPITLAVLRCLVVEAGGHRFALPLHRVVLSQAHDAVAGDPGRGTRRGLGRQRAGHGVRARRHASGSDRRRRPPDRSWC